MVIARNCNRCGKCVDVCPRGAITLVEEEVRIDRAKCDLCMKCVDVCSPGAIVRVGEYMTVEEVVEEVSKDEIFYSNSGGGITISGGEPLLQWEFTSEVLKGCKERAIHTAIDTCGHANWEVLEEVLRYTELALFDVKHMNSEKHRKVTGVGNELILSNAEKTSRKVRTWIRIPIIPGFNDSEQHMKDVAKFVSTTAVEKISLLGYHEWGKHKYEATGRDYALENIHPLSEETPNNLKEIAQSYGLTVTIGY
jgi:pyruvate formate lyase activating enzyme